MTAPRTATLAIREVPITDVVAVRHSVEVHGNGPLVANITDGVMAIGGIVVTCSNVEGSISASPVAMAGEPRIVLQLDIAHPHQQLRVAASFAVTLDDFARLLDRMRAPLELGRFEAKSA